MITPEEKAAQKKKDRITATIFGILAMIALIALVYAFIQQVEATKQRDQAIMNAEALQVGLEECQKATEAANEQIKQALLEAQAAKAEAVKQNELAQQSQSKSKKNKP